MHSLLELALPWLRRVVCVSNDEKPPCSSSNFKSSWAGFSDVGVPLDSRCRDVDRVHAPINFACDAIMRYNSYERRKDKENTEKINLKKNKWTFSIWWHWIESFSFNTFVNILRTLDAMCMHNTEFYDSKATQNCLFLFVFIIDGAFLTGCLYSLRFVKSDNTSVSVFSAGRHNICFDFDKLANLVSNQ